MPAAAARDENGWPFYDVASEGFGLAIPPDWLQFDMNPATFDATLRVEIARNPEFEPLLGGLRQQLVKGVKFVGFDRLAMGSEFTTNVNVLRIPLTPDKTLDTIVEETLGDLDRLPSVAKPVTHERLKLPSGDWEKIQITRTTKMPTGKSSTQATSQFVTVRESNVYVVTLTTLSDQEAKYVTTFEKIARSFRFTK